MSAPFIRLGGYTINTGEVLHASMDRIANGSGGDIPVLKIEFIRKGVIYLRDVTLAEFNDALYKHHLITALA